MGVFINGINLPKDKEFILLKVFPDGKTRIGLSTNYTQAIQMDLIMCKECKHSKAWYRDRLLCDIWAEDGMPVFEDGYCYYGERK